MPPTVHFTIGTAITAMQCSMASVAALGVLTHVESVNVTILLYTRQCEFIT